MRNSRCIVADDILSDELQNNCLLDTVMQASRFSQKPSQDVPAAPDTATAPSEAAVDTCAVPSAAAALAVNQALDSEPPTLCLHLDSATQPELMPLQDPTPLVSISGSLSQHLEPVLFLVAKLRKSGRNHELGPICDNLEHKGAPQGGHALQIISEFRGEVPTICMGG